MKIHESGEMYLETILVLFQKNGSVRSIDIAHELNFSKPSVSRAMGILKSAGLITMDEAGQINLTPEGKVKAESIYERHRIITAYLIKSLGLDPDLAEKDACRIEHIISQETFEKMKLFVGPEKKQ